MKKINLKGSLTGVKKIKEMKNPDILYSNIFNKKMCFNNLNITKEKNDLYYIYHDFSNKDHTWSGRYYEINVKKNRFELNDEEKSLLFNIKEWQCDDGKELKNIKIKIFFSKNGHKKLKKIFNN